MLSKIAAFEARYQLRSPLFFIAFALFFLMTFSAVTIEEVQIGAKGNTFVNAPFAILQTMGIMNLLAIFVVTAFVANVVIRDDETGFAPIMRATRVRKFDYIVGRFAGAFGVAFLISLAVPLAIMLGAAMPWQDAEKIGPFVLGHYVWAQFVFVLPTLLLMSAGFFALATATRSMMWTYVGVVAFVVLFSISRVLLRDPSLDQISALADPFGVGALGRITKYWTAADRNTQLPALEGVLLWNRLIWTGLALALFLLAYRLFRFDTQDRASGKIGKPGKKRAQAQDLPPAARPLALPRSGARANWLQFAALTRFDMRFVFRSPAFLVLLLLGVFNALAGLWAAGEFRGVLYLPVTRTVVEGLLGSYTFIPVLVAVYYAGELVWRDRERRIHEIVDASAAPSWTFLAPKVLAITGVLLATLLVGVATGLVFQMLHGYGQFQFGAYALWFLLPSLINALLLGVLAVFAQAIVPHKYVGWALMLVYTVASTTLGTMGFEHKLYNYADVATVPLSDMNAMGHFWIGRAWQQAYWGCFALMLLVLTHLLWRRGPDTALRPRLARLRAGLRGTAGWLLGAGTLGWLGCGAWVYYNSNVLNRYETQPQREQLMAEAERELLGYEKLPQPTITKVRLKVDLFPRERRAQTEGSYLIENRSGQPIDQFVLSIDPDLHDSRIEMQGATLSKDYPRYGHRLYTLAQPMQPGEQRELRFSNRLQEPGFVNDRPLTRLVENGSFLHNFAISPMLDVNRRVFLQERSKRRKHGLPPELRVAKLEDPSADAHHYLRHDSDWVDAEITLSTDADQVPLAPGYTVSDVSANGRRTLVTRTEAPIHNFFSLQSARYAIAKEQWKRPNGEAVDLSVYYHAPHAANVPRMLKAMQVSLQTFSAAFGDYQFRQARILEFPAYEKFAQAFAGTMPYSEGIGFIQDFRDDKRDENVDLVSYVTAHEVAHQWWAHQVVGADKQGMSMLSETFAQYSAMLVLEKLYGREQLRRFLKFELDRYLRDRSSEAVEELPLARVENQGYVHYRKGALVMYWLKESLGEATVNRALRRFLADYRFKSAPFPSSLDFLRVLREEAGAGHEQLISDLFEKITLYDLKALDASAHKRADGKYELSFSVEAKKLYADGKGKESEAPLNEDFEVGAFTVKPGERGFNKAAVLKLERRPLVSGRQQITLLLDRLPEFVGIDPYNMRIDRNADDNLARVSLKD